MNERHTHAWKLSSYGYGILRGKCECEAVQFFPSDSLDGDREIAARIKRLNQEYGKEGKVTSQNHPVPPKPETKNVSLLHRYYEENKEAMLHDLDTMGEKPMRQRWWNMSQATLYGLLARWRPDYPGLPRWSQSKAKKPSKSRRPGLPPGGAVANPGPLVRIPLVITDQDLIPLEDYDFDKFWAVLGQIVRRRIKGSSRGTSAGSKDS